ncbi:hypothetical protein BST61_g11419 [Cercospora zeina]
MHGRNFKYGNLQLSEASSPGSKVQHDLPTPLGSVLEARNRERPIVKALHKSFDEQLSRSISRKSEKCVLRKRILEAQQHATDQQYQLLKRLLSTYKGHSNDTVDVVEELELLEDMKEELRTELSVCWADREAKDWLDNLIEATFHRDEIPKLCELPVQLVNETISGASNEQSTAVGDEGGEAEETLPYDPQKIINDLNLNQPHNIRFYDATMTGLDDVAVTRATAAVQGAQVDMADSPQIDELINVDSLQKLDRVVTKGLQTAAAAIRHDRFTTNMKHFMNLKERPEMMAKAKNDEDVFNNVYRRLEAVEDNMFHVKALVATMVQHDLIRRDRGEDDLQDCLKRMWALVAVMYGCVEEGCLWLTVMDSLLEDLGSMLVGDIDPRLNTVKMQKFRKMRESQPMPDHAPALDQASIDALERSNRARTLFAEAARMYRGAIQLAYTGVSWKKKTEKKHQVTWFQNLLQWSYRCGAECCIEKLQVRQLEGGGDPDQVMNQEGEVETVDADTKEGKPGPSKGKQPMMDPEEGQPQDEPEGSKKPRSKRRTIKQKDDIVTPAAESDISDRAMMSSRSSFLLSVSVADSRVGFPGERAEISKNRQQAYPCLIDFVRYSRWHPGYGPFFHYFAHL